MKSIKKYGLNDYGFTLFFAICFLWVGAQNKTNNDTLLQEESTQLSKAIIFVENVFFVKQTKINYKLAPQYAQLFYKNSTLSNANWKIAPQSGIVVKKTGTYQFQLRSNENHSDSEISEISLKKVTNQNISNIVSIPKPNQSYSAQGTATIFDFEKGSNNFRDHKWLGYNSPDITFNISLNKKNALNRIFISMLQNQDAWIFFPTKVEVIHEGKIIAIWNNTSGQIQVSPEHFLLEIPIDCIKTDSIQIRITNLEEIPEWHPGKGTIAWFFIDEIIIE